MAIENDLDEVIEQYRHSVGEFTKGSPEPQKELFSHREDVTLANPLGPPARGWEQVDQALDRAASTIRDGHIVDAETVAKYATPELAYVVEIEQAEAKIGGREEVSPIALRVTTIFRPEDGVWKVAHRDTQTL